MRLLSVLALLALTAGCASGGGHPDGSTAEPQFSSHEGRPEAGHRSSGGGSRSQSGDDGGDGVLGTILDVLFGGDDS